jgi:hypothetical protein
VHIKSQKGHNNYFPAKWWKKFNESTSICFARALQLTTRGRRPPNPDSFPNIQSIHQKPVKKQ